MAQESDEQLQNLFAIRDALNKAAYLPNELGVYSDIIIGYGDVITKIPMNADTYSYTIQCIDKIIADCRNGRF